MFSLAAPKGTSLRRLVIALSAGGAKSLKRANRVTFLFHRV